MDSGSLDEPARDHYLHHSPISALLYSTPSIVSASAVNASYMHVCTEYLLIGPIHNRDSWLPCSHSYLSSIEEQVRPG